MPAYRAVSKMKDGEVKQQIANILARGVTNKVKRKRYEDLVKSFVAKKKKNTPNIAKYELTISDKRIFLIFSFGSDSGPKRKDMDIVHANMMDYLKLTIPYFK